MDNAIGLIGAEAAGSEARIVSQGGVITKFEQGADQVYYRVFSGDKTQGSWLTAVKPIPKARCLNDLRQHQYPSGSDYVVVLNNLY